jgi:hypothetical protein
MVDGTENKRSKPWSVGAAAAFGRNLDDGGAQALCRTQDVRAAEDPDLFDNSSDTEFSDTDEFLALEIVPACAGKARCV